MGLLKPVSSLSPAGLRVDCIDCFLHCFLRMAGWKDTASVRTSASAPAEILCGAAQMLPAAGVGARKPRESPASLAQARQSVLLRPLLSQVQWY